MSDLKKYENIPQGDMPGDKICIGEDHVKKAELIFPKLKEEIASLEEKGQKKIVVCVCGGSGVGKSEIASLLSFMMTEDGRKSYVLSGDNYPHRIPSENDAMREKCYKEGGEEALKAYLGSQDEIDFEKVDQILKSFKEGEITVSLKRMGRTSEELWYDDVDFSDTEIVFLEWTHGNSDHLSQVDIPVLLNSTPEETLAHRRARNRDGAVDSPFVMMVLNFEQEMLKTQAHKAKIIVSKSGELMTYDEYKSVMGLQ